MRKRILTIIFLGAIITGILFAGGWVSRRPVEQLPQNVQISEEEEVVAGTIKNVVIEPGTMPGAIITVTTDSGDVEIVAGPIWRFFELKPGMEVELNVRGVSFNDETFKVAFGATVNGVTIKMPYRNLFRYGFSENRSWGPGMWYERSGFDYDDMPCHSGGWMMGYGYNYPGSMMRGNRW
ncbi:hypothetical protein JYK00_08570 [Thermosipho ferrireducens]|uniref:Uncharacterized protein n=1 Tax=Thermosipho ferrireducens TaxID=2571116 RepID=A0ABX7S5F3_9BACT|nr:hypothetical protein [Thermosipho ferrireducens]QTA37767.1 hypothetical protein JYK00_08570 [Thermosipho ferrireducens]